jgi:hypothetical protein
LIQKSFWSEDFWISPVFLVVHDFIDACHDSSALKWEKNHLISFWYFYLQYSSIIPFKITHNMLL